MTAIIPDNSITEILGPTVILPAPGKSAGLAWKRITNGEVMNALRASNATVSRLQVENITLRRQLTEAQQEIVILCGELATARQGA